MILILILDREKVYVPKSKPFISFIGEVGKAAETVITWQDKASDIAEDGSILGTYRSASVTVASDYFCASHVTFQVKCSFCSFVQIFCIKKSTFLLQLMGV